MSLMARNIVNNGVVSVLFLFITYADSSRGGTVFTVVCLSVFSARSQKSMQLGSPNLTYKCSTMSPGNAFILGSKGQRLRTRVTKPLSAWVFALL